MDTSGQVTNSSTEGTSTPKSHSSFHRHDPRRRLPKFDLTPFKSNPKIYEKALAEAIRQESLQAMKTANSYDVQFSIYCPTSFGQRVMIVGNHEALGNWNPGKALQLSWTPGDIWTGQTEMNNVPDRCLEFKYILVLGGDRVKWEDGQNRVQRMNESGELRGRKVFHTLQHKWKS